MVTLGRVQNGVVVLENDVRLPEGQEVTVLALDPVSESPRMEGTQSHSSLEIRTVSLGSVIGPLNSEDELLGEMLEGRK